MFARFASLPQRRIIAAAGLSWLIVRELQTLLTVLSLPGSLAARFGRWYFWDAGDYLYIAWHGYTSSALLVPAYFPGYPMLVHVLLTVQVPWQVAMLLVANLAALGALLVVGMLVFHETGKSQAAVWAVLLLAVSPLGTFLSAMYSDSLFLLLVAGCWLAARHRLWWLTGVLLALAVITRPFGVMLAVALLVELILSRPRWQSVLWLVLPSLVSVGGFCTVLWHTYGSPFQMFHVETHLFGHALWWPWQTLAVTFQQFVDSPAVRIHIVWDGLPLLLCLVVVAWQGKRWPLSFSVYVLGVVLLCLIMAMTSRGGPYPILADGRYTYAAAPLLLIPLGCLLSKRPAWQGSIVLCASVVIQLVLTFYELHGGWLV